MLAYEHGRPDDMAFFAYALKINDETVVRCYLKAVKWADATSSAAAV
ncbi:MAG: hypothetical protein ACUVQV_01835 [Dissulfurimicrobium sp.]